MARLIDADKLYRRVMKSKSFSPTRFSHQRRCIVLASILEAPTVKAVTLDKLCKLMASIYYMPPMDSLDACGGVAAVLEQGELEEAWKHFFRTAMENNLI